MNKVKYISTHRRPRNAHKKHIEKKNENIPMNEQIIDGRYIKQETLGQGAFGLVYKAFDQETGKTVAIKCLKTKESIDSFKAELDLLKRLHHSAIVPYVDSFYDKTGSLQIVMEYADNGSILDVIHKYGNLNENAPGRVPALCRYDRWQDDQQTGKSRKRTGHRGYEEREKAFSVCIVWSGQRRT